MHVPISIRLRPEEDRAIRSVRGFLQERNPDKRISNADAIRAALRLMRTVVVYRPTLYDNIHEGER